MQKIHYVMVGVLAFAASAIPFEAALPPVAQPYIKALAAGCVVLGAVLGAISESATKGSGQ